MHLRQADMVKLLRRRYPDYRWELIDSLKSPHIHYKRIKRILSYTFPVRYFITYIESVVYLLPHLKGEIMETEKDQHNGYRVHIPSLDLIVEVLISSPLFILLLLITTTRSMIAIRCNTEWMGQRPSSIFLFGGTRRRIGMSLCLPSIIVLILTLPLNVMPYAVSMLLSRS